MWCTRKAMVRCHDECQKLSAEGSKHFIALQVHDEILFDFPYAPNKGNLPKVRRLQSLMQQSGDDLGIPLRVAITYHPSNWGEGESCA